VAKTVRAIPATISRYTAEPINSHRKRRVAGYARVSTDHDDQVTSYEAQVDYYTSYIKGGMTGNLSAYTRMKASRQPIPGTVMGLSNGQGCPG
jgi:hypothetical protein